MLAKGIRKRCTHSVSIYVDDDLLNILNSYVIFGFENRASLIKAVLFDNFNLSYSTMTHLTGNDGRVVSLLLTENEALQLSERIISSGWTASEFIRYVLKNGHDPVV